MTYTIQCYVKKVVLNKCDITSLKIRPTGKSRIEGKDDWCLGWGPDRKPGDVKLFPVDITSRVLNSVKGIARYALLKSKFHDCEIEIKMETEGCGDKIVGICGVTIL